ncbi:hypothetical protein GCM10022630_35870 [Thermobifida alba]
MLNVPNNQESFAAVGAPGGGERAARRAEGGATADIAEGEGPPHRDVAVHTPVTRRPVSLRARNSPGYAD